MTERDAELARRRHGASASHFAVEKPSPLGELVRAVEALVSARRGGDVIERVIAGWLAAHPHPTREVAHVLRRTGLPHLSRGAGSRLGRMAFVAALRMQQADRSATPQAPEERRFGEARR